MFMPNADGGPGQMFAGFFNNFLAQASSFFGPFLGQMSNGDPTTLINGFAQQFTQAFGQLTNLWSTSVMNQMQRWNHMAGGRRNMNPDVEIITGSVDQLERARRELIVAAAMLDGNTAPVGSLTQVSAKKPSKLRVESYNTIQSTSVKMDDGRVTATSNDDDYMRAMMEHFETARKLTAQVWTDLEPKLKGMTSNQTVPFLQGIDLNSDAIRNVMIDLTNEMNELWKLISDRISEEMAELTEESMPKPVVVGNGPLISEDVDVRSESRRMNSQAKMLSSIQYQLNSVYEKVKKGIEM